MMISAEEARKITAQALEDQRAYVRARIERESEQACEKIRYAASCGSNGCRVETNEFDDPAGVARYLSEELGYSTAEYKPESKAICVSWKIPKEFSKPS